MNKINWKFVSYYRASGYLLQLDKNLREAVVFLPDKKITFIADIPNYLNIEKMIVGKVYIMEFAIYSTLISKNFKRKIINTIRQYYSYDDSLYRKLFNLQKLDEMTGIFERSPYIFKFELIKIIDRFYSEKVKNIFEQAILDSYRGKTKFRWRHLLGF